MDNKKIKQIIAKEGLIIIGIMAISLLIAYLSNHIPNPKPLTQAEWDAEVRVGDGVKGKADELDTIWDEFVVETKNAFKDNATGNYYYKPDYSQREKLRNSLGDFPVFFFFLGYPVYLLIRFILWAIRTLKEK